MRIIYGGRINRKMAGFYRSTYRAGDQEKILLSTQFEESDARRAFPCMDHPSMKATFDLELVIDEHLEAVSNMPVLEVSPLEGGKKRILFQRTPRMSTYLLFFGVGEWEFLKGEEGERTRLAAVRGMARYGHFALAFASRCLSYCEEALGVPYPLPKMDLLAVPDFAFGAMENWGAIAFRENLLLKFPDTTSRAGQERICEVIAHEMVHQWFGNLVTP
ncbi:MAG: M1 family peptidase, partial [Deltaproteobacteria bacterium]|nr:M1 family peptidase [Deltaproteobacteria bacterium]